jgi:hypothetical protein
MVFDVTNPKEAFAYWITERYKVLKKREAGEPKPWSNDPIFQSVYFTNVHREDDRTTKFIRQWAQQVDGELIVPAYVFARMINRAETLEGVTDGFVDGFKPERLKAKLTDRRDWGAQIFSGAYLITTCGVKMDKIDYVVRVVSHAMQRDFTECRDCQDTWEVLKSVSGLGSFLAAQVVADLKNTVHHPLEEASDWHSFVASGPGSKRGVNYWLGRTPEAPISEMYFKRYIAQIREETLPLLDGVPVMCNQDLQNCLCEFSKYMRVRDGGRTKRNYPGV